MTQYVIRCWGWANGQHCPHEGQLVRFFNHEAYDGQGYGEFTTEIEHALKFESHIEALGFWNKRSSIKPDRQDGKPNRPMTGMTAEIVPDTLWSKQNVKE